MSEFTKVRMLILNSNLTVLRSMEQAREILKEVRRQETDLVFAISDTTKAHFKPIEHGFYSIWEPNTNMGIDPVFQPSIVVSEAEAVKRLYTLRKHYNKHWRED